MSWNIIRTDTFSKEFKKYKKDSEFIHAFEAKLRRLQEDPENVGGYLSGKLHGYKSTRIIRKLRLIFKIVKEENNIYLCAIDYRGSVYENFEGL